MFVKGHHIGRPKGSKPRTWANIDYWYRKLEAEFHSLTPLDRAKISLEVMKCLMNKLPVLPKSAADSVANASETLDLIKSLESKDKSLPVEAIETQPVSLDKPNTNTDVIKTEQTIVVARDSAAPILPVNKA
jgi:hypothetical protein